MLNAKMKKKKNDRSFRVVAQNKSNDSLSMMQLSLFLTRKRVYAYYAF
jgi:hypothetical protein